MFRILAALAGLALCFGGHQAMVSAAEPEPYVVECLEGTPGPALWSDGTTRFSQWCFDTHGGPEYLEEESKSGLGGNPGPRGYTCYDDGACYWPDGTPVLGYQRCGVACGEPPTSGDIQRAWFDCLAVKSEAQCREEQASR